MMFDKALQNRSLPKDQWPKQIMGTNVSVKLMNTVEDFYDLEETCEGDIQDDGYYGDHLEIGLSAETAEALAESMEEHPTIDMKSIKCRDNT